MTPADRPLPASAAQTIADLRAARALIAKGWTRGRSGQAGSYSLIGALDRVQPVDRDWHTACEALRVTINRPSLAVWNDAQPSKRPVLAAIDATIARLEASA